MRLREESCLYVIETINVPALDAKELKWNPILFKGDLHGSYQPK